MDDPNKELTFANPVKVTVKHPLADLTLEVTRLGVKVDVGESQKALEAWLREVLQQHVVMLLGYLRVGVVGAQLGGEAWEKTARALGAYVEASLGTLKMIHEGVRGPKGPKIQLASSATPLPPPPEKPR